MNRAQYTADLNRVRNTDSSESPLTAGKTTPAGNHPLRVLVVEDSPVQQKAALVVLEQLGYQADVANNGLEAVRCFLKHPYHLILMDLCMPEMNGLESARLIRLLQPDEFAPVIIAVTSSMVKGDLEQHLASVMNNVLKKPLLPEQLQAEIKLWFTNPP